MQIFRFLIKQGSQVLNLWQLKSISVDSNNLGHSNFVQRVIFKYGHNLAKTAVSAKLLAPDISLRFILYKEKHRNQWETGQGMNKSTCFLGLITIGITNTAIRSFWSSLTTSSDSVAQFDIRIQWTDSQEGMVFWKMNTFLLGVCSGHLRPWHPLVIMMAKLPNPAISNLWADKHVLEVENEKEWVEWLVDTFWGPFCFKTIAPRSWK